MENLKNIIYQIRDARHITLRDMTGILQLSAGHLSQIENNFKLYFKKQQDYNEVNINVPSTSITYKTSATVKRFLNTINIKEVEDNIKRDTEILSKYYINLDNISKLECELLSYNQELILFKKLNFNKLFFYQAKQKENFSFIHYFYLKFSN